MRAGGRETPRVYFTKKAIERIFEVSPVLRWCVVQGRRVTQQQEKRAVEEGHGVNHGHCLYPAAEVEAGEG